MAVLPSNQIDIFTASHTTGASKKIPSPSPAALAAIASGRTSTATDKPPLRRMSSATSASVKRKANPEKRANHNAVERARRDSLNQRFLVLASQLPAISDVRRPSKALIVNRSLQFVNEALAREEMYRQMIKDLHERSRVLTGQLNEYRVANGLSSYVETVPELNLPIRQVDVPKEKPNARVANRKGSTVVDWLDDGEGVIDDMDDASVPMERYPTNDASLFQPGFQMGAVPPHLAPYIPAHVPTNTSLMAQSLTKISPATVVSSPASYSEPPVLSPTSSASPMTDQNVMMPMLGQAGGGTVPMFSSGVAMPDPGLFGPQLNAGLPSFLSAQSFTA